MTKRSLRIAMIAPPWFDVPPPAYGGIEQMVADLVDGLVQRGHEVTLIGAGRNGTRARFLSTYQEAPGDRLGEPVPEVLHAARAARLLRGLDVDVVHDHCLAGPLTSAGRDVPTLVTVHGPVNGELGEYYAELGDQVGLVAISDAQRGFAPRLNWVGTVHNAIRVDDFPFRTTKDDYVLFLGRMCPDKGLHVAIEVIRRAGMRLVVAAKCREEPEKAYFEEYVKPLLGPDVEYLGEVTGAAKRELLANARCLLFPIQWEEPFGLVMIEALACGTPVVALRRGSVPEIVRHGVTGLVHDHPDELVRALSAVEDIDPHACRLDARRRFDLAVMTTRYEQLYRRVAGPREVDPSSSTGLAA